MTRKRVKEGRKWEEERGGGSRALCRGWALRAAVPDLANQRPPLPTSSNVAPTYETGLHPSFTSSILSSIYLLKQQAIYSREPPRTKKSRHDISGTQKSRCQTLRRNSDAEGLRGQEPSITIFKASPTLSLQVCVVSVGLDGLFVGNSPLLWSSLEDISPARCLDASGHPKPLSFCPSLISC